MRRPLILMSLLCGLALPASAQLSLSLNLALPGVSIGIEVPSYPNLVQVPGYPVYYAPGLQSNFFFYDGMYWVYQGENWYASDWYDGPWGMVSPQAVPLFVLRIPVRYYRNPPGYFRGWGRDAPPRWGEHWGPSWQQQRAGWDRWNRRAVPAPAPLPLYQRQYRQDRYPQAERQRELRDQHYRYQPRDSVVRQHFQEQAPRRVAPTPPPPRPMAPQMQPRDDGPRRDSGPSRDQPRDQPRSEPRDQPRSQPRDQPRDNPRDNGPRGERAAPPEPPQKRAPGKPERERERDKDDERGQGRGPDRNK